METWTQQDEAGNTLNLPGVSAWALLRRQVQTSQQVWPGPSEQVATRLDMTLQQCLWLLRLLPVEAQHGLSQAVCLDGFWLSFDLLVPLLSGKVNADDLQIWMQLLHEA